MTYSAAFTFWSTATGQAASMTSSVVDLAGTVLGVQPAFSFVELGGSGSAYLYAANSSAIPNGQTGYVKILLSGVLIAGSPLMPSELETYYQGQNVAAVTGAVGSVAGNVGGNVLGSANSVVGNVGGNLVGNVSGNVSGSVASVTGSVGSVAGAVGSVAGNVGGNVLGSVGSVSGAVGSVSGDVGGNVGGKVLGGGSGTISGDGVRASSVSGGVVGSVGSVTGNVGGSVNSLTIAPIDSAGVTTLLARIGAFTGTGINTVLGVLRALARKAAESTPADIGGSFDNATDSLEAQQELAAAAKTKIDTVFADYQQRGVAVTLPDPAPDGYGGGSGTGDGEVTLPASETGSTPAVHTIKQGDTLPVLEATLTRADGTAANLTGATVKFHLRKQFSVEPLLNVAAEIVAPATQGKVRYTFVGTATLARGDYEAEFEVTFGDESILTFPNAGYLTVRVVADIA